jgi:hypothetical protein
VNACTANERFCGRLFACIAVTIHDTMATLTIITTTAVPTASPMKKVCIVGVATATEFSFGSTFSSMSQVWILFSMCTRWLHSE